MKKRFFKLNKLNRRSAFGVLFSLLALLAAVPFWAGALIERYPYADLFSAEAPNGFYANETIKFRIKGGDKQDSYIDARLEYGDGRIDNFRLYRGQLYTKDHQYTSAKTYSSKLILRDSAGHERSFKLNLGISQEWQPRIKTFSFNETSSNQLDERVCLNYEIDCQNKTDYKLSISWGDGVKENLGIYCGPSIISHAYEGTGSYNIKLLLQSTKNNKDIDARELRAQVQGDGIIVDALPKARFFIKTAWPIKGERVYFQDSSLDPQGRNNLKRWEWDFGDGSSRSYEINPSHIYTNAGEYRVSLKITNFQGRSDEYFQWVEVFAKPKYQLVRVSGQKEIYQIVDNKRHWIPTPEIFLDYGFKSEEVKIISQAELNSYSRAKLLQVEGENEIYYLTESKMKRRIPNMEVFYSYGNKLEDIILISQKELNWYPENRLIKYNDDWKIYLLENNQKRWIKTAAAFNRLGLDWTKIAPVNWTEFNAWQAGQVIE